MAIGIDLGTSYSCVGVMQNENVKIIANDQGNRTTPSCVSFSDDGRRIGDPAMNANAQNFVFNVKRLIGRKFNDPEVQSDIKYLPFTVFNKAGKPCIRLTYHGKEREFCPEEISSMILLEMKETAEAHLGRIVTGAVVSIPANFNYLQRQATRDAGTIAGLHILELADESVLAAIAYGFEKRIAKWRNVLIFDLGGGTVNASLLEIEDGIFEVKATAANTHLGGEDFDNRLVDHFIQEFKRKHKKDLSSDARAVRRLRTACERAKRRLSTTIKTSIEIDSLYDGTDFHTTITRVHFEELCQDLFRDTLEPIESVLRDSKIDKTNVEDIVLVGGSTRIPRIVELVTDFFDGKKPKKNINPDEAVAHGAAISAAILSGHVSEKTREIRLLPVAPLSLGIETDGGVMDILIKRNTAIPTKKSKVFSVGNLPSFDNQFGVHIRVYEGDHARTEANIPLGDFGFSPAIRGSFQIEITFDVDVNNTLNVSARDRTSGKSNHIIIANHNSSREEIERMIHEAEMYRVEDEVAEARISCRDNLESYVYELRDLLNANKSKLESAINETIAWLDISRSASKEEYEAKRKELEGIASPVLKRLYGNLDDVFGVSPGGDV